MKRIRGEEVNGTDWFKDTLLLDKTGLSVVEVEEKGNPPQRKYDFNASGVVPPTIDGFEIEIMNENTATETYTGDTERCPNCDLRFDRVRAPGTVNVDWSGRVMLHPCCCVVSVRSLRTDTDRSESDQ